MDVKLLTGNIFRITKFKLFLQCEIMIMKVKCDYIIRGNWILKLIFYVNVGIINWSNQFTINKYIFQEESKEMIEHNYFREVL